MKFNLLLNTGFTVIEIGLFYGGELILHETFAERFLVNTYKALGIFFYSGLFSSSLLSCM